MDKLDVIEKIKKLFMKNKQEEPQTEDVNLEEVKLNAIITKTGDIKGLISEVELLADMIVDEDQKTIVKESLVALMENLDNLIDVSADVEIMEDETEETEELKSEVQKLGKVLEVNKWEINVVNDEFKVGDKIMVQYEDEDPFKLNDGEYELEDGRKIQVDGDGIIVLITENKVEELKSDKVEKEVVEEVELKTEVIEEDNKEITNLLEDISKEMSELKKVNKDLTKQFDELKSENEKLNEDFKNQDGAIARKDSPEKIEKTKSNFSNKMIERISKQRKELGLNY